MPLYRAAVAQFRAQVLDGSLVPRLVEQYRHRLARSPALAADEVQRREMFRLQGQQQTAYRLDCVLSGPTEQPMLRR